MIKRCVCISIMVLAGCSDKTPQNFTPPAVPVRTAKVEVRDVPFYFEGIGTVAASQTVEIKAYVSGEIQEVCFKEGAFVNKGDPLYVIESGQYAVKLKEAEAQLLQNMTHLRAAQKKLERYKSLSNGDLIAKVEWDELESKIALHEAFIKADEAKLDLAKRDLTHCYIKAPISGRIGKTALKAGSSPTQGACLATISSADPFIVDFFITEKERSLLSSEEPRFELYSAGTEDRLATGNVTFVDHVTDAGCGMFVARGTVTNVEGFLSAGQVARVRVFFGSKENGRLVPLRAVKTNQLGPYVFSVTEDGSVEMRSVKLGPEENGMVLIEEGLEEADKVVVTGHLRLFPGAKVEDVP